jgi:hypothetical protein
MKVYNVTTSKGETYKAIKEEDLFSFIKIMLKHGLTVTITEVDLFDIIDEEERNNG